jgi:hypothetical protein
MRARPVGRTGVSEEDVSEATSELNHDRAKGQGAFWPSRFLALPLNLPVR